MTPQLVLVEWEDASQVDEGPWVQRSGAEAPTAVLFKTAGWLLELTRSHVVLTATMGDHLMAPRDRIPRGMVRSIHVFDAADGKPMQPIKRKRRT